MKEDQLFAAQELAKQAKIQDLRNDWEKSTDRKLQANAIRRRVQTLLHETEFSLEARRERYALLILYLCYVLLFVLFVLYPS
jgi:hypothetical protein